MLGHSQGAILPRWSIRDGAVRAKVDDLVLLAGPQHGTEAIRGYGLSPDNGCAHFPGCTASMWQFDPASQFITDLNGPTETYDGVDYTSIYTDFDELVRPPESSALAADGTAPGHVVNVRMQDLCPGRPVDHAGLFIDHVMKRLAVDAFPGVDPVVAAQVGADSFTQQRGFHYDPAAAEPS